MHSIGRCLLEMNKLTEAIKYLEKALQVYKEISLDVDQNKNVAITMHVVGSCLLKLHKHTEAKAVLRDTNFG